jgi:hypothetical protein
LSQRAFEVAGPAIGGMIHGIQGSGGAEVTEIETLWRVVQGEGGCYRWDAIPTAVPSGWGGQPVLEADDGERAWHVSADQAIILSSHGCALVQRLLDPSWVLTHDLALVGETTASGRPALMARASARASRPRSGGAPDMAAERDLTIDAERGFLHSDIALVEGRPYDVMELRDIAVDVEVDPKVFVPDIPPGMAVADHSRVPRVPPPWQRRRRWHAQWPLARW